MKIISGGQTGVDQAALRAAKDVGLKTGGFMPARFRTQSGPRPDMARTYGMIALPEYDYPTRTEANVEASDVTLIFGNDKSPGCKLTKRLCRRHNVDVMTISWPYRNDTHDIDAMSVIVSSWLKDRKPSIINVAGNREESMPGISEAAYELLTLVFQNLQRTR